MNNNRNQNRRRGRGNRQQGGGGNQMNRIDSRARGNAPQMLDKYKKLAQDAQHNGDRVQAEYYLQFADHYFRVISDNRVRQDEQRGKRPDDRDANDNDDGDEDEFDGRRQQQQQRPPRGNRNRNRRDDNRDDNGRDDDNRDDDYRERDGDRDGGDRDGGERSGRDDDGDNEYEPAENPFTGGKRNQRGRARRSERSDDDGGEIDAAALPPSIAGDSGEGDEAPRRRPARRRKNGDEGEALKAVG